MDLKSYDKSGERTVEASQGTEVQEHANKRAQQVPPQTTRFVQSEWVPLLNPFFTAMRAHGQSLTS